MEMASSKKAAKQRSLLRKAIKDCDAAVKIDPSWVRAYQRKAESLLELEQVEESISAAEQGLHVSDGTCPHCSKLVSKVRLQQMKASNKSENNLSGALSKLQIVSNRRGSGHYQWVPERSNLHEQVVN